MKYTLATAAIVIATTAVNAASNTPLTPSGRSLWQGELFVISTNGPCVKVGDARPVVFEPKGFPGNNSKDKLRFSRGIIAGEMVPASGNNLIGITNTNVNLTYIDRTGLNTNPKFLVAFTVSNLPAPPVVGKPAIALGSSTINMKIIQKQGNCTFALSGALTGPF